MPNNVGSFPPSSLSSVLISSVQKSDPSLAVMIVFLTANIAVKPHQKLFCDKREVRT